MNFPSLNNRGRILRAASMAPGIHLRELARSLGISLHSVRYHVESLSRSGMIICERRGGYSRIFPVGATQSDILLYSFLRNNSVRKVLSTLCSGSKLTNKEICQESGLAKSTVSEIIQKLTESNLVQLELSETGFRVGLQDPDLTTKLLQEVNQVVDLTLVDNFIELWDF